LLSNDVEIDDLKTVITHYGMTIVGIL